MKASKLRVSGFENLRVLFWEWSEVMIQCLSRVHLDIRGSAATNLMTSRRVSGRRNSALPARPEENGTKKTEEITIGPRDGRSLRLDLNQEPFGLEAWGGVGPDPRGKTDRISGQTNRRVGRVPCNSAVDEA